MQTISINKNNAITAFNNADATGKKLLTDLFGKELVPEKITDRVKTFDDALAIIGGPSENFKILMSYNGLDPYLNGAKAMAKLNVIATALNEGWKPDWNNSSEYKWYPWFKKAGSGLSFDGAGYWGTVATVGSRLCFKSRELAEYAAEQFEDIYTEFMSL